MPRAGNPGRSGMTLSEGTVQRRLVGNGEDYLTTEDGEYLNIEVSL